MNINTIFKAFVGRDINLSLVDYETIYENEDIKAATALMFILQYYDFPVPQNYNYRYTKSRGIYSFDLAEDILEQNNEPEDIELDERMVDFIQYVNLSVDVNRKVTSGLTSAVQYYYYDKYCKKGKSTDKDYRQYFPQRHPKDSYNLGKAVWKSLETYAIENQVQPE